MQDILLINPSNRDDPLEKVRTLALAPLSLALLAACTPERYTVRIVDEAFEDLDLEQSADLVGITCMTPLAPRAYALAEAFRLRGVPVVMGGVHASMRPEEALGFADSVVIGEAETTWATVLEDARLGRLRRTYESPPPSLEHLPAPRRDLLPSGYFVPGVKSTRIRLNARRSCGLHAAGEARMPRGARTSVSGRCCRCLEMFRGRRPKNTRTAPRGDQS